MLEKSDLVRSVTLLSFLMIAIIVIILSFEIKDELTYTIISEIWIAVAIAMIVYHYSKKTEEHNKNTLKSIENMIRIQYTDNQWIKNEARFKIIHDLNNILDLSANIIQNAKELEIEKDAQNRSLLKISILKWQKELSKLAIKNLESKNVVSTNFFSFNDIQQIELIIQQCKIDLVFDENNTKCNYHHLESLQTFLPNTIKKYEEAMT